MLDWKHLSARQRFTSVFFAAFLALLAATALMLAMLLNPDAVRGSIRAMNPLAGPTVCKALYAVGFIALMLRAIHGVVA